MRLIITAFRGESAPLLKALKDKGSFTKTVFRDVLIGDVKDFNSFLEWLVNEAPLSLSRVVPLNEEFIFKEPADLINELIKRALNYLDLIKGRSFRVTVERRGLKEIIKSRDIEKSIGELLFNKLKSSGLKPVVKLEDPEVEFVIEILNNQCGISLLTSELKNKSPLIRAN